MKTYAVGIQQVKIFLFILGRGTMGPQRALDVALYIDIVKIGHSSPSWLGKGLSAAGSNKQPGHPWEDTLWGTAQKAPLAFKGSLHSLGRSSKQIMCRVWSLTSRKVGLRTERTFPSFPKWTASQSCFCHRHDAISCLCLVNGWGGGGAEAHEMDFALRCPMLFPS